MEKNNYYEWFGLPVESFDYNQENLKELCEKKLTEWRSSKTIATQNRAALYESDIKQAISDKDKWESYYKDFKLKIDKDIVDNLQYIVIFPGKTIPADGIKSIADSLKISKSYVEQLATKNGYSLSVASSPAPSRKMDYKKLEPATAIKNTLSQLQKSIEELGFDDLAVLINDQKNAGISLKGSTKDEFISVLTEIKDFWGKKNPNNPAVAQKKSLFGKITIGMIKFIKDNDIKAYISFLEWKHVNDKLTNLFASVTRFKTQALPEDLHNRIINEIYSLIGKSYNRDDAKDIVESYCDEKKIGYPVVLPQNLLCPNCSGLFGKKNPVQDKCPICGYSYQVKCPKCGKTRNILGDMECCGIDLLKYPLMEKKLEEGKRALRDLSFGLAKSFFKEVESVWPGMEGLEQAKKDCASLEAKYKRDFDDISNLVENKKLRAAKTKCDTLIGMNPSLKSKFQYIYDDLDNKDVLYKEYNNEKSEARKKELLHNMLEIICDDPLINALIPSVENVTDLDIHINAGAGTAILDWKSKNAPNSVNYHIIRKKNGVVSSYLDGEEIGLTQNCMFSDSGIVDGEVYFYAVYASLGSKNGNLTSSKTPVILLKDINVTLSAGDKVIEANWSNQSVSIEAYYSEKKINKYGDGNSIAKVTQNGFTLGNLSNDKTYYIACYKVIDFDGKKYHSEGYYGNATPMEELQAPEIEKSLGKTAGQYIISSDGIPMSSIILYYDYAKSPSIPIGRNISAGVVDSKLKKLNVTSSNKNSVSVQLDEHVLNDIQVYPVHVKGNAAISGKPIRLKYIKPIVVKNAHISGNDLILFISEWPNGAEKIDILYSYDTYPKDVRDFNGKNTVLQKEYEAAKSLTISNVKNASYYITLFAKKGIEAIPICNYKFDNKVKKKINYQLNSYLGKVSLSIVENDGDIIPEIVLVSNSSYLPLNKDEGEIVTTIPERKQKKAIIPLGIKTKELKGKYVRLFTENADFMLNSLTGSKIE